jgi:glycosyltransferase involved in cell wall biosynthesis
VKVLFVSIDLFSIGGIQRYSRYLLDALRRSPRVSGVCVASLGATHSDGFDMPLRADLTGGGSVAGKIAFAAGCWRLARARRASLVVVDHVNLAAVAWVFRLLTGTPYWLNVYAIEVWGPLSWLRRRALLGAACIVSDCDFTRRYLEERYPALASRIIVVPDCVDIGRFVPAAASAERGALPVLLTVSRLAEGRSKGHDAVLRALAVLRARGIDAAYVIAGDGPDRARLERLAGELGLADRVRFGGRVPDGDLPALYQASDVFVLVSAFQTDGAPQGEGVPLVVIEAQACGKPAVTSALDGSAESVVHGETGLLVDPSDEAALVGALQRLLCDGPLRERMGAAARAFAERQFSVDAFESKIDGVLSRFGRQPGAAAMRAAARELPRRA